MRLHPDQKICIAVFVDSPMSTSRCEIDREKQNVHVGVKQSKQSKEHARSGLRPEGVTWDRRPYFAVFSLLEPQVMHVVDRIHALSKLESNHARPNLIKNCPAQRCDTSHASAHFVLSSV
eukprot:361616-Chlamydomonas_euryale.AAC.18